MSPIDKQKLRQHFKAWRKTVSQEAQIQAAQQLIPAFWRLCYANNIDDPKQMYIGFYHAIANEVPTDLLLQTCLHFGAHCFLPVMAKEKTDKILQYREVLHDSEFVVDTLGIQIPKHGADQSAATLTHMLVPALAVTKQGARLGFGEGYFDATIHEARAQGGVSPQCWGVVYQAQCVDELPQAPWDERLDAVICVD